MLVPGGWQSLTLICTMATVRKIFFGSGEMFFICPHTNRRFIRGRATWMKPGQLKGAGAMQIFLSHRVLVIWRCRPC